MHFQLFINHKPLAVVEMDQIENGTFFSLEKNKNFHSIDRLIIDRLGFKIPTKNVYLGEKKKKNFN